MESRDFRISGSEEINIDPVEIDTSLVGQVSNEYEELKSILVVAQSGYAINDDKMKRANEKIDNMIKLAKRAIKEYKVKKNDKRKEELKEILIMVKKAKIAAKAVEMRYMLENDNPESVERRRLMTGWTREQAEKEGRRADPINDIDIPIIDGNDLLGVDR